MPEFRVQAPDGSIIRIEAADKGTAMRGAQEHYASKRSQPPKNDSLLTKATGFMANVNRGLGIGDEIAGAVQGTINAVQGKSNPYAAGMRQQRATEDRFQATNPTLAALGRGVGNAGTVAVPFGQAATLANASRAGNAVRGAVTAGLTGAAYAAADRGTLGERAKAAGETARNPLVLGLGAAGGALAPAAARRQDPRPKAEPLAETVSRFDRAGVDPMLAAAGGKGSATMTNVVAENPIAGVATRGRLAKAVDQADRSAQSIAEGYGAVRGRQIAGENLQAGVKRFATDGKVSGTFKARSGALYDEAFDAISAAQRKSVQAEKTTAALRSGLGGASVRPAAVIDPKSTTEVVRSIQGRGQSPALRELFSSPQVRKLSDAVDDPASLSFQDLRDARTWVREARSNETLSGTIGTGNLKQLEIALSRDITGNAEALAGPRAAQKLRRADQYYAAGQGRIERALEPFNAAKSGENAYSRVVSAAGSSATADARKLISLKRSLNPDEWGDVAANVVSELGKPGPGASAVGGEGFSVATFVTNYNKMSPRGREVLFGATGGGGKKATELRAALDNLASVADSLKNVEKGANASKSFVSAQGAGTLAGLVNPSTAVPTGGVLATMSVTGEMMTNPAVVRWLARIERTGGDVRQLNMAARQLEAIARRDPSVAPLYQAVSARLSRGAGTTGGTSQQAYAR